MDSMTMTRDDLEVGQDMADDRDMIEYHDALDAAEAGDGEGRARDDDRHRVLIREPLDCIGVMETDLYLAIRTGSLGLVLKLASGTLPKVEDPNGGWKRSAPEAPTFKPEPVKPS